MKKPHEISRNFDQNFQSLIQFAHVNAHELSTQGLRYLLSADLLSKKDESIFAKDVVAYRFLDNTIESAKAKRLLYDEKTVHFEENVIFKKEGYFELQTQKLSYDIKQDVFQSDTKFILIAKNSITKGDSFVFDKSQQNIKATAIHSRIELDK